MWAEEAIMEKSKKRAQRRKDTARMLQHAKRVIDSWYFCDEDRQRDAENFHLWAKQMRDNMQQCSCSGCGNPRHGIWNGRLERLTMQEIRSEDSFHDQIQEYFVDPNENDE